MERFDCLSTILYYKMNEIIGDRELVSIRRYFSDFKDTTSIINSENLCHFMMSGSKREGLYMAGSDVDIMCWLPNIYVICDKSQSPFYNTATDTLILAEHRLTRPGFVLLRLLHQACTQQALHLIPTCISLNNHIYVSSSKHRQFQNLTTGLFPGFGIHGPCASGCIDGQEGDLALCFRSLHWPPQALSWLQRCQRLCWPRPSVLHDITHCGCHFVAIGAKQSIFENVEWRLSFSKAEQKLIYSFNHCQLLVYGLLKLFLKEVLNSGIPENQKLLCSYFLKTALFWQIQDNILTSWSVDNFLLCFWNCFKLLIKWVNYQYCPNFFIPQNNMFFPKITGRDQQRLILQLLGLYNEGVGCLLRCASIRDKIMSVIFYPYHTLNFSSELQLSEIKKDCLLKECGSDYTMMDLFTYQDHIKCMQFFRRKFRSSNTQASRMIFYMKIFNLCQRIAFFQMTQIHGRGNKEMYTPKKQSINLLKQTSRLGCLTDKIYLAMYYYIDGRYTQALCLLQEMKCKLYRPYILYVICNPDIYGQAMVGKSLSTKMKEAFAHDILIPYFAKIPEIRLELRVLEKLKFIPPSDLIVSPFVFVHFLTFLCHHHLECAEQRQQDLHDLHTVVHNCGRYISFCIKDTAWQLLGICHAINQNPQQALQCYKKSLTIDSVDIISLRTATHYRIKALERQFY